MKYIKVYWAYEVQKSHKGLEYAWSHTNLLKLSVSMKFISFIKVLW